MQDSFEQLVAELCDGDKNLKSRDSIDVDVLQGVYELEQEKKNVS